MNKIILIAGPTASGKSRYAMELARESGGEIVSADSMQIYRGMDIGTAKPTRAERAEVRHHMIDIVSPLENYSAYRFQAAAEAAIAEIASRGKQAIVCGGTGLYLDSLLYEMDFAAAAPSARPHRRNARHREDSAEGEGSLFKKMKPSKKFDFDIRLLLPADESERAALYNRIDRRVDKMMDDGLLEEARSLLALGLSEKNLAYNAIGYKEIFAHFAGELELAEAVELIKRNTRRYAKRQITWMRKYG
jgi:tRNA dimethylallyltransferase